MYVNCAVFRGSLFMKESFVLIKGVHSVIACLPESELRAVEEHTEQCYREGMAVVTDLDLLWGYYIQWCRERVEDDRVADTERLRVSAAIELVSVGERCETAIEYWEGCV